MYWGSILMYWGSISARQERTGLGLVGIRDRSEMCGWVVVVVVVVGGGGGVIGDNRVMRGVCWSGVMLSIMMLCFLQGEGGGICICVCVYVCVYMLMLMLLWHTPRARENECVIVVVL